jgi:Domain of unknown function (DUF4157)
MRAHDEEIEGAQVTEESEARSSPSPLRSLQRSLGNSRLGMLRAAVQRQAAPEWMRRDLGLPVNDAPAVEPEAVAVAVPAGGQPLPAPVQARAEAHLGVPMDDVNVVTGGDSACAPIGAQAFTTEDSGRPTVVLGNSVDLGTPDGQFTMMHELGHVAQQKRGLASDLSGLGGDEGTRSSLEAHADEQAAKMTAE